MTFQPGTVEELARELSRAARPVERADLSRLSAIREHNPEDMTATVEAGMTLAALQDALRPARQWAPLDPPGAEELTIGDLLAFDLSGPRRFGYGGAREHVIGMRMVLGSGEIIKAGGKVVKNVAGYDLCRLFIGARHTLGIIVEAAFKLRPLPEMEVLVQRHCANLDEAERLCTEVRRMPADPVVFDLHNVERGIAIVLGFAGASEDVEQQAQAARALGFAEPAALDYDAARAGWTKLSVLPSAVFECLRMQPAGRFVARAGNGAIYHERAAAPKPEWPEALMARVKSAYDPRNIFPAWT